VPKLKKKNSGARKTNTTMVNSPTSAQAIAAAAQPDANSQVTQQGTFYFFESDSFLFYCLFYCIFAAD
jgi:hypothetical protein